MTGPAPLTSIVSRLQAGLPLLAVAGLAAFTWWLVQSVPDGPGGRATAVPPSTPDYVLGTATVERFSPQGVRLSVLHGARLTHYLEGDLLVVDDLRLVAHDPSGDVTALARQGRYQGAASVVELIGMAKVTASPAPGATRGGPLVFDGEALSINTQTRELRSTRPVRLTSPDGIVRGSSMVHDADTGVTQLGGRVAGVLQAPAR